MKVEHGYGKQHQQGARKRSSEALSAGFVKEQTYLENVDAKENGIQQAGSIPWIDSKDAYCAQQNRVERRVVCDGLPVVVGVAETVSLEQLPYRTNVVDRVRI